MQRCALSAQGTASSNPPERGRKATPATALLPNQDEPPRTRSNSPHSKSSSSGRVGCSWLLSVGSRREFVISDHGPFGPPSMDENRARADFCKTRLKRRSKLFSRQPEEQMGWTSERASMGEIAYCPVEQAEPCLGHRRQAWIPRRSWSSSSCSFFWAAAAITAGGAGSRLYQPGSQAPPQRISRISVFTSVRCGGKREGRLGHGVLESGQLGGRGAALSQGADAGPRAVSGLTV
jgi:hypothetical protein